MTTFHLTMSLDTAIKMVENAIKKRKRQYIFEDEGGGHIDNFKCLRLFKQYKAEGKKYVPVCDNVKEDGGCKGHKEGAKPCTK